MCLNETYSKVHTDKYLSDIVSSPLLFNYDIKKIQENQLGLKFNGPHQFLVCADDVNLL
jgi:hypothetical protein